MLKPFLTLFLLATLLSRSALPQYRTDLRLISQLRALTDTFHGVAGVYVLNLRTGREAAINADTVFPTASIVKIPILVGIFDKIAQGAYTYHQSLVYRDSLARKGSGLMQFFKDSTPTDLQTAVSLMITHSDNSAAVWCEKMAGGGVAINAWLSAAGFTMRPWCWRGRCRRCFGTISNRIPGGSRRNG
jgi:beta-lactamase class A